VEVFITDVYRKGDQLFIRYVIDNRTVHPYAIGNPKVFALEPENSLISLHGFRYAQVGSDIAKKIRSRGQERIETVDCEVPSGPLAPGETASGILIAPLPPSVAVPVVLRFLFPREGREPISVTLVL
jgi:hypothetical protein